MTRPGILTAEYRYIPITDAHRAKLSAAHRARLGLPDGHCRIYGVHVPLASAEPLRTYAADMARRHGYAAAKAFVERSVGTNVVHPFPPKPKRLGPYLPPKEYARLKMLRRFARGFHIFVRRLDGTYRTSVRGSGPARPRIDWELVEALFADGATEGEIVSLFGVNQHSFRNQAIRRGLLHPKRRLRRDR